MRFIKKNIREWNFQSIIVALCIFGVCVGTQQMQTVKWDSGIGDAFNSALEVWMAIIIMSNYKWKDIVNYKLLYSVYAVLGIALSIIFVPMAIQRRYEFLFLDTIVIALGMFLMGFCIIHTLIHFFVEKYRPKFYKPLFIIWVVMLVLMIFSKSDFTWPERYFVLFLCYYMTEQTPEQRANVSLGCINGIILAFMGIQAHSLLCRPYDRVRYYGNFCNPNHNCLFLCFCLAAILAKILYVTKEENTHKLVRIFWFLMAGACYSFIFMTMTRSGYLAAVVVTIFFLVGYCKIKGKKVFVKMGALLVGLFIVTMPLTYLAVRYIPTIHPYVLFYFQEGYVAEERVHSWDPRDSEKYVSFEELMNNALGRFAVLYNPPKDTSGQSLNEPENDSLKIVSTADYIPVDALEEEVEKVETDPDKIPALESETDAFLVRYTIYKWYITHLSLRGMPYDEQGFQLTEDHWIQDTHNIYLDYGINFGIPVMILFMVFIWWGIGRLVKYGIKACDMKKCAMLLVVLVPPIFGMFEFAWGVSMLATVVFYIGFKEMFAE